VGTAFPPVGKQGAHGRRQLVALVSKYPWNIHPENIGPLAASALEASAGNGHQFSNGRFFAAWLGLVPREYSTGGKTILLGISKRGNTYLRRLLIHGARSCVQTCDRQRHPLGAWITRLEQRMHRNKVIVALANKIARVAWKILIKPDEIYRWAEA
jgi:transposase